MAKQHKDGAMPVRIVVNPVVLDGAARAAKVQTIVDAGRPPMAVEDDDGSMILVPRRLIHVSAISDGLSWSPDWPAGQPKPPRDFDRLSLVGGVDLTILDDDPEIINLLAPGSDKTVAEMRTWLTSTPQSLGWGAVQRNRVLDILTSYGASTSGIAVATPLWQIVNRLASVWSMGWDIRDARTQARSQL